MFGAPAPTPADHADRALAAGAQMLARRALLAHVTTYTLAFVPALIWLAEARGASVTWVALLIAGPHLLQDDGRLIGWWMTRVKHVDADTQPILAMAVDQTFHFITLLALAVATSAS